MDHRDMVLVTVLRRMRVAYPDDANAIVREALRVLAVHQLLLPEQTRLDFTLDLARLNASLAGDGDSGSPEAQRIREVDQELERRSHYGSWGALG